MATHADAPPVRVALIATPESTPAAIYGLFELFASVGSAWEQATGESCPVRRMEPRIVAAQTQAFVSPVGLPIAPQAALHDAGSPDLVIVTDLAVSVQDDLGARWPLERRWVADQYRRGAMVCSVCTGALLLAEAGLLDGHEATTHWSVADVFPRRYPSVRLRPERVLCVSGPDERLLTGGGSSAWEDLALYLIARHCGSAEAVRIARLFLLGDRSEGQLPYAATVRARRHADGIVRRSEAWVTGHLREPNPVARMVEMSGLPERTFKRRFKAATGHTPVAYVQLLRIEHARSLLQEGGESVDEIAWRVGYEDPAFFRRLFKRHTGVTPARYRQRVQSVGKAAA